MNFQNAMKSGVVCWITGLSGAGKTTIGRFFAEKLRLHHKNVVFLDGDILREIFGGNIGHAPEERLGLAKRYSRLCRMLADQKIIVVCATHSMFHEVRNWNRENIENYWEIYLKVPMDVLIERDQKQLYSRALRGEIEHVMGIDEELEEPENPDIVLLNDGSKTPDKIVEHLISELRLKI